MAHSIEVLFNPKCSKCRGARDILEGREEEVRYVHYLDEPLSRARLEHIARLLGIASPREMMRTGESAYAELGLEDADDDRLYEAMVSHPVLIQRPIVVRGERAVIARPPERLLDLFGG